MALLTSISEDNRVVEQGNTYQFHVEPAVSTTGIVKESSGDGDKYYDKATVQQWKGEVTFSKRYRYVGMTKGAAETAAGTILTAYTKTFPKWAVGIQSFNISGKGYALYCYVTVGGDAPMACAAVTPVHVDGAMWDVEVDVSATVETYSTPSVSSSTPPSVETLKGLVSDIVSFPEFSSPQNTNANNGGAS